MDGRCGLTCMRRCVPWSACSLPVSPLLETGVIFRVLACACVGRSMLRPDVGGALKLGGGPVRLPGGGQARPRKCPLCSFSTVLERPLYDMYVFEYIFIHIYIYI